MIPLRDSIPSSRRPVVTHALVAVCALVFLIQLADPAGVLVERLGMIPARVVDPDRDLVLRELVAGRVVARPLRPALVPEWLTLLTCTFLHGGWLHVLGNMLFLWIFGDNLEDQMGHTGFLVFYLLCGMAAAAAQILSDPQSGVSMVGASGAIAGVMGGYLLLFPRARVDVLIILVVIFRIIPLPGGLVLGVWFALQIFGGFGGTGGAGVAYWAHAGGFVAGILMTLQLWVRRGGTGFWERTQGHPPHPEITYGPTTIPRVRRRR